MDYCSFFFIIIIIIQITNINSLRPRQNGCHSADDTFKRIFLNENIRISTKNSLKFVPKGLINNIPALVLIMAWRLPGDKPLSETMLVRSLTHICVTRPQWVNDHCGYGLSLWGTKLHRTAICHWVQPMRDEITLSHRLSLAEPIPRMISEYTLLKVPKETAEYGIFCKRYNV